MLAKRFFSSRPICFLSLVAALAVATFWLRSETVESGVYVRICDVQVQAYFEQATWGFAVKLSRGARGEKNSFQVRSDPVRLPCLLSEQIRQTFSAGGEYVLNLGNNGWTSDASLVWGSRTLHILGQTVTYEEFVRVSPEPAGRQSERFVRLYVPDLLLFGLCILYPIGWYLFGRRVRQGYCKKCGYDLRGSKGHCPECGRGFVSTSEATAAHALRAASRNAFIRLFAAILSAKCIAILLWQEVVPHSLKGAWPGVAVSLTSAPSLSRFLDRPEPELASVVFYCESLILNSAAWAAVLRYAINQITRRAMNRTARGLPPAT